VEAAAVVAGDEIKHDRASNDHETEDGHDEKGQPTIVNIDHDAAALAASTVLCETLGTWSHGMAFRCSDASSVVDLHTFDVVFLAALVGVAQREKEDIIVSVARRMREGALMVVRSAHGLRTLLYPVSFYFYSSF
jgi:nicotianamine synthase